MSKIYDTIVIGGGLAGLTATHSILKRKKSVLLLEKEKHVGGRASTFKRAGFYLDSGAVYFMAHTQDTQKLFGELRISEKALVKVSKRMSFYYENNFHELDFSNYFTTLISLVSSSLISNREVIRKKSIDFLRVCVHSFREGIHKHPHHSTYRDQTAKDFLLRFFSPQTVYNIFEPFCESFLFVSLDKVSASAFIFLMGSVLDSSNNIYHFKKGMGFLSERLAANIKQKGGSIIYNREVTGITRARHHFIVSCRNGFSYSALSVIYSIPMSQFKKITSPLHHAFTIPLHNFKYLPAIVVQIAVSSPLQILSTHHLTFLRPHGSYLISGLSECTHKTSSVAPKGNGLLYILLSPHHTKRFFKKSDAFIVKMVDEELYDLFDDYKYKKLFSEVFRWKDALVHASPEYMRYADVSTSLPGFFICGDSIYIGLDGVITSGLLAAEQSLKYMDSIT